MILTTIDIRNRFLYISMNIDVDHNRLSMKLFTYWRVMFYSEDFFPHLRAAKEQALNRDLEQIRMQRERSVPGPTFGVRLKRWSSSIASGLRARFVQVDRQRDVNCVGCLAR